MVTRKGFAAPSQHYLYPYPVYRSPVGSSESQQRLSGSTRSSSMGLATVIRDYGTEILNAIRENDVQKLKFILEKTLRSDAKIAKLCVTDIKHKPTKKFACPLILAARQEDPRIIKYMMDKGTDPNFVHHTIFSSKRREIVTALHLSVDLGYYDTTEVLLNANADANIYDHNQETPLHIAVKKADHMMTKLLLSKGADPAIPDRKSNAALHIATLYGHLQMVKTLLKYDADIYQKGYWDAIPPHIAAKEGHIHLIQLFSSRDIANINVKIPCFADRREKAPLHLAAENGHVECVMVLLDQFDADVNLKDSDGNTALHCVVLHPYDVHRMRDREFYTECAKTLIKFRVSINEKNIFGDTALHFAAMNHYHRIVELLLEVGANPFLENEDGMKPIDTVPDSDPVTKQLLKMAMMKGKPSADANQEYRRFLDSTMGSGRHINGSFDRTSRTNLSHRSVSSMSSSVFIEDGKSGKSGRPREGDGRKQRSKSRSDVIQPQDEGRSMVSGTEASGVYQKIENEIPVYSKVDKKKQQEKVSLGYDQQEWEQVSSTTFNEESMQGSIISQRHKKPSQISQEVQAEINRRTVQQQTNTVETSEASTQPEMVSKKNRKNKPRKPSTDRDDISLDTPVPQSEEQSIYENVRRDVAIYENLPSVVPPLPPRSNRPPPTPPPKHKDMGSPRPDYRNDDGVHIHTLPGRPGSIAVQYKGGPITISVDTPAVEEDSDAEAKKKKKKVPPSPKTSRKHSTSPNVKSKDRHEHRKHSDSKVPKSPKTELSPKKKTSGSIDDDPKKRYYSDYYQKKYLERKASDKKKEPSKEAYALLERSIEEYFNGTFDITELETLQQSMMSESSQPELIKQIIHQKITEITDQKAKSASEKRSPGQKTGQDKMQTWLMGTGEDEESEDEDPENIVDSDEWEDDEEFHTPNITLNVEQKEAADDKLVPNKGPLKSTPLKPTPPARSDTSSKDLPSQSDQQNKPLKPPTPKDRHINKTPTKLQITKVPNQPIKTTHLDDVTQEDEGSISPDISPNNSPQPMSFREKLAWAKKLGSGDEDGTISTQSQPTKEKTKKNEVQIVSNIEEANWRIQTGSKSTVVESATEAKKADRSRDMDGDDEHEDDSSGVSDPSRYMEVGEYEGSPFSRRKIAQDSIADHEARPRSKSQDGVLLRDGRQGAVSPVNLKDVAHRGLRTGSVTSTGSGLGLRVSADVPKAYSKQEMASARQAFMMANPARIESSSECSDSDLRGSRGSLSDYKDRGKLWADPMLKPIYPKHSSELVGSQHEDKSSRSDDSSEQRTQEKSESKIIGGYAKPYKSFGKIDVKTNLIDEAMIHSSFPEDQDIDSDEFENSDDEGQSDTSEPRVSETKHVDRPSQLNIQDAGWKPDVNHPRHLNRENSIPPPLPLNSPPALMEASQLSPRSDTSSKSGRKVVSLREEKTNSQGDVIETVTTTVLRHNLPHEELIQAEILAPTDDLSFGDSTFDEDIDELVRQNSITAPHSELPPPPPELMGSQEELIKASTNMISVHVEELDEEEAAKYMQKSNKKSKSKKSTENLDESASGVTKKKRKKKSQQEGNTEKSPTEDKNIDYGEATPRGDQEALSGIMDYDEEPGARRSRSRERQQNIMRLQEAKRQENMGIINYAEEPSSMRTDPSGNDATIQRLNEVNKSMTDIEVAEITDAAEARRKARETARAQRQWHKKMLEEGKDPNAYIMSRSHSRETSNDRVRRYSKERKDSSSRKKSNEQQRRHSPSPTRRQVSASPKSYTITVEDDSKVTATTGDNLPEALEPAAEEEGSLISMGSKRAKKKKTKKSTESLVDEGVDKKVKKKKKSQSADLESGQDPSSGKKKKKKRTGSNRSDHGSTEDIIPQGKVQGAPPETANTDVWKEAMEGQPLASSETVYGENIGPEIEATSVIRRSKRGKKGKAEDKTRKDISQKSMESPNTIETSDPSLEHMIKRAVVPHAPNNLQAHYEFDSDNDTNVSENSVPTLDINTNVKTQKQQKKLDRLGKKYKVSDEINIARNTQAPDERNRGAADDRNRGALDDKNRGAQDDRNRGVMHDRNRGAPDDRNKGAPDYRHMGAQDDRNIGTQDDSVGKTKKSGSMALQRADDSSSEGSEDISGYDEQYVPKARFPILNQQKSYETNIDDFDEITESGNKIPSLNLTDAQRAEMRKAREIRQQEPKESALSPAKVPDPRTVERNEKGNLQQYPRGTNKQEPVRKKFGIRLDQDDDESGTDDESLQEDYIKRVTVPASMVSGGKYEISMEDSEERISDTTGQIQMTEQQKADIRKAREVKRLQESMDKIARQKRLEEEEQERQRIRAEEEKNRQLALEAAERRRQAEEDEITRLAAQFENEDDLNAYSNKKRQNIKPQQTLLRPGEVDDTPDDDSTISEILIRRANIPAKLAHKYEISQDSDGSASEDNISSIGLSDAQKVALAKAREEKRHAKAAERKEKAIKLREEELKRDQSDKPSQQTPNRPEQRNNTGPNQSKRPKHSIGLAEPGANQNVEQDDDDYSDDDVNYRANVPEIKRYDDSHNVDEEYEISKLPMIGLSDSQKAAMASIREAKLQQKLQAERQKKRNDPDALDEYGYLVPLPYDEQRRNRPDGPMQGHQYAMDLPVKEDEYVEINDPMPDDMIRRIPPPNLPPPRQRPFEKSFEDLDMTPDERPPVIGLKTGKPKPVTAPKPGRKPNDVAFKNAAFAKLKSMQGQNPTGGSKTDSESSFNDSSEMNDENKFSRNGSGRALIKRGPKPVKGDHIYIDKQPDLIGEDALPPDGNTDDQLQRELAKLRGEVPATPRTSEIWHGTLDQEREMELMLQAIKDPSELADPHESPREPFSGRASSEPPGRARAVGRENSNRAQSVKPPKHPSLSDRRPPRGANMNDSLLSNQSTQSKDDLQTLRARSNSPLRSPVPPRVRSNSAERKYSEFEYRARSDSEGKSPRTVQPVKRRIRRAYPSEGDLPGHQSDTEALRRSRQVKSISFYGDLRRNSERRSSERRRQKDKAPVMKTSQSLEEAAWQQIRQDMDNQPKLRAHRVIKPQGDKPINYTRGVYRPTPVYWRGSQRSIANTSRYDDSELIDQLWNERHRSMGTGSEGEADLEDMSYDPNMTDDRQEASYGPHEGFGSSQFSQSIPDDERLRMAHYNSAPTLPSSVPPYPQENQYFGAFQPVGPPKKVTILEKKKRKPVYKDQKDLPPRIINSGPVDFDTYGTTAKLWMEQVGKSETQKSDTMYLSTMGDNEPPAEIVNSLPKDGAKTGDGAQWVIARGRSLKLAKYEYDRQREMGMHEGLPDQGPLDPGKQMLLFFKIGDNWKDLAWVLFEGLCSDGDIIRMLKEIQHRHPDKVNDQVHDMMHRWWQKKGSAATIEELQHALEVLRMAYVEEEYFNPRGIFSEVETEPEAEMSSGSEDDAEVNRLIHDYKNRSLNASFENKNAATKLISPNEQNNNAMNTGSLLKKLEEAAIDHIPSKINRSSITRSSPQPAPRPMHDSYMSYSSDFDASGDGSHGHSFVIVQPQVKKKDYKHETNM